MIRVVVVDDAPFIREIVRSLCEGQGIDIIGEACDGNEAVKMVLEKKPDVVLMDIIMPNKSGLEATKEILAALPQTKIIAFSTEDQEQMMMRAVEAGCCSYITKPFTAKQLLGPIKSSVGF